MEPITLNLWAVVLLFAAVHGLGLSVLLFRRGGEPRRARLALAWLALMIALLLIDYALMIGGFEVRWPLLTSLLDPLWFAVGPLFYAYVRLLLPGRSRWEPEDVLHILPLLLMVIRMGWVLGLDAGVRETLQALPMAESPGFTFSITLYLLQSVAYAFITTALVRDYARGYRREASGAAAVQLEGLQRLLRVFWVYAGMTALNVGLLLTIGYYSMELDFLVPLTLAGLVYVLGYLRLREPAQLFPPLHLPIPNDEPESMSPTPELLGHAASLRTWMENEQPYLDPDLRLADLAAPLGIAERTLSQVLSDALGVTFYDYVNGYRVAAIKARLLDPASDHLTVLGVAMECGFSSKASFNRVFKKVTGTTPSEYRARATSRDGSSMPELPIARVVERVDQEV